MAPSNVLMDLFSAVANRPILKVDNMDNKIPELAMLRDNWQTIREEAEHLFSQGIMRRTPPPTIA